MSQDPVFRPFKTLEGAILQPKELLMMHKLAQQNKKAVEALKREAEEHAAFCRGVKAATRGEKAVTAIRKAYGPRPVWQGNTAK
jgi:hypothetical protein